MIKGPHLRAETGRARRVLIVRIGAMGDVLHAMPAVAALRQRHPEWFIGWAVDPCWQELLRSGLATERGAAMPLIDRCYAVPTREWNRRPFSLDTLRSIRAVRRELRGERFDLCVDTQGTIRSSVIGRLGKWPARSPPRPEGC